MDVLFEVEDGIPEANKSETHHEMHPIQMGNYQTLASELPAAVHSNDYMI